MKPKHRVMCPDCFRPKMQFKTEKKALNFIKWNGDDLEYGGDRLRAYYCPACCAWHISCHAHTEDYDRRTERLIASYHWDLNARRGRSKRMDKVVSGELETLDQMAMEIWDNMPVEIQMANYKAEVKRFLTDYFNQHGIGNKYNTGWLRNFIYNKWTKNRLHQL